MILEGYGDVFDNFGSLKSKPVSRTFIQFYHKLALKYLSIQTLGERVGLRDGNNAIWHGGDKRLLALA